MGKMDALANENLFLLEFLVDEVKMDSKCDCDTPPGEHCVSFQFLDNDPLDVCEADFTNGHKGKEESLKSGKSCLFSLTPEQVQEAMKVFDVTVSLFKKMEPGWLPDKILIGTALISITNLFAELVESVEAETGQTPTAKTLKDTFDVTNSSEDKVGKISIYIRMSCFGKLIVTQFQMNLEDKSVLFKDKGGQSLYRYKKAAKAEEPPEVPQSGFFNPPGTPNEMYCPPIEQQMMGYGQIPPQAAYGQVPPPTGYGQMPPQMGFPQPQMGYDQQFMPPPNMSCPMQPCYPDPYGGMQQEVYNLPCNECMMMMNQQPPADQMLTPCIECGTLLAPKEQREEVPCPPPDPPGNYQEIGASMGGNSLTIRVHKDKNKVEQVEGSEHSLGTCTCTADSVGGKKKKELTYPSQKEYQLSPGIQQGGKNLPFSLKMGGTDCTPNNNIIVNPAVCTKPDGTKCVEISDPNKETFVLRIGKKSEGLQKKANLELELCTPRGPELKPIPKKETREMQTEENAVSGGKKKGDKKKGDKMKKVVKKGKGKKKKK